MIRAIFFDFYGVWTPDVLADYITQANQINLVAGKGLADIVEKYYHDEIDLEEVVSAFKTSLGMDDIKASKFTIRESDILPEVVKLMRWLHSHFVKLGILANLGYEDYETLRDFNKRNKLFEVIAAPLMLEQDAPLLSGEVFAQALRQIGEPPRACLVVSGNPDYLKFAASLGIDTLRFKGLPELEQELKKLLAD